MMGMGRESTSTPDMAQNVPTSLPNPQEIDLFIPELSFMDVTDSPADF
jgi:hypothetical protein